LSSLISSFNSITVASTVNLAADIETNGANVYAAAIDTTAAPLST
jgi:hypothetical protein